MPFVSFHILFAAVLMSTHLLTGCADPIIILSDLVCYASEMIDVLALKAFKGLRIYPPVLTGFANSHIGVRITFEMLDFLVFREPSNKIVNFDQILTRIE